MTLGTSRIGLVVLVCAGALACDGDPEASEAPSSAEPRVDEGLAPELPAGQRAIYVPAYSHLSAGGDRRMLLAVTLSVRNVDPAATVTLHQVEYFDTAGHRVRRYLTEPRTLGPFGTAEFSVEALDDSGGSGANFLVSWEGPDGVQPLLTEAIMFGHVGTGYMSFTSRGVELARPETPAPEPAPSAPDAP